VEGAKKNKTQEETEEPCLLPKALPLFKVIKFLIFFKD